MSKFSLGQALTIAISGESGFVVGICTYLNTETSYRLHYLAKDGSSKNEWIDESLLENAALTQADSPNNSSQTCDLQNQMIEKVDAKDSAPKSIWCPVMGPPLSALSQSAPELLTEAPQAVDR